MNNDPTLSMTEEDIRELAELDARIRAEDAEAKAAKTRPVKKPFDWEEDEDEFYAGW